MDELFTVPEQLSPRLAWMKKHAVEVMRNPQCMIDTGEIREYSAWKTNEEFRTSEGHDADEAIANHARKYGLKLWNEEGA